LERSLDVLTTAGGGAIEEARIASADESSASLQATISFPGNSQLHARLRVVLSGNAPMLQSYSFHYMLGDGATIFRYDNARHHPGLPFFPHHKHDGADEGVYGCRQPSIRAIRDEIAAYLA
jgi:hypothetical protein